MLELPVRTLAYIGEAGPVSDLEAHFRNLISIIFQPVRGGHHRSTGIQGKWTGTFM